MAHVDSERSRTVHPNEDVPRGRQRRAQAGRQPVQDCARQAHENRQLQLEPPNPGSAVETDAADAKAAERADGEAPGPSPAAHADESDGSLVPGRRPATTAAAPAANATAPRRCPSDAADTTRSPAPACNPIASERPEAAAKREEDDANPFASQLGLHSAATVVSECHAQHESTHIADRLRDGRANTRPRHSSHHHEDQGGAVGQQHWPEDFR